MRMLIQDVAKAHLTAATSHLNENISQKMEDLQLMLEKSAVPKPRELGMFHLFHLVNFKKISSQLTNLLISANIVLHI